MNTGISCQWETEMKNERKKERKRENDEERGRENEDRGRKEGGDGWGMQAVGQEYEEYRYQLSGWMVCNPTAFYPGFLLRESRRG